MAATPRIVQVDSTTRRKPAVVQLLAEWEYLERSLHRMLCGWGRQFPDWTDKVAVSRHVWDQAECVRRLRERLVQFPGTQKNLETPVSESLEALGNAVIMAPSLNDAVDGIYQLFINALVKSYLAYAEAAHPIHDAPTLAAISENVRAKEQMRLWLRDYRRRNPGRHSEEYGAKIAAALAEANGLNGGLPVNRPAGVIGLNFRPAARCAHPKTSQPTLDIMPVLESRFRDDLEIRRLFWCYGYLLEMNLAEEQLIWLYDAHELPWEFQQDVSRHMWDESRHGDSGHSRLLDFGISIDEIGYPYYGGSKTATPEVAEGESAVLTPKDLYDKVFFIGMVAETGHFHVKHEAYDDFKAGGDLESAEMMLFDIIDETSHVQYAHRWLPLLAERAGIDSDFRADGAAFRARLQAETTARVEASQGQDHGVAGEKVEELLSRMRGIAPLSNAATCPPRSYKPM